MDGIYATLSRQSGLMRELDVIAQNIANAGTTGYRAEAVVFAEHVAAGAGGAPSLSMGDAAARHTDLSQGALERTGGTYDLAIEGDGFFQIGGPDGPLLTRAGTFSADAAGTLVTPDGLPLLDAGGAPVAVPPGPGDVAIAPDGTLSRGGRPFGEIGLVRPDDPQGLVRVGDTRFRHEGGVEPVIGGRMMQGFLEGSNTSPVIEIARMIAVQNAYGMGQSMLDREDERLRAMMRVMDPQ
ncbi:flagellar hook-basal body complex protein [Jannaschia sp. W003]|uniref:flagellar hook-basal body complex protein n=1 Tax=Jannaschia sp. W003 TaxID=2867012 RepID=UPI0021A483ED|nr:flagellar hook-basal body complex protein [Jannaschia sp. W003]UWQ21834.1 flagellar hook-basal body complex protein [Jannaschia sp. W003]